MQVLARIIIITRYTELRLFSAAVVRFRTGSLPGKENKAKAANHVDRCGCRLYLFCRDMFLVAAREGVIAEAKRAHERERSGQPRALSEEYEAIIEAVTTKRTPSSEPAASVDDEGDEEDYEDKELGFSTQVTEDATAAPGRQVDKEVIAAADAAGAALSPEERRAGAVDVVDVPLHEEPGEAVVRKKLGKRSGARRSKALGNSAFEPARIVVNPRCVTTYAGVSHTQLALDLFGSSEDDPSTHKYEIDRWAPAPETFVCQEMRTTGGRTASKQQRRTAFRIAPALAAGWEPS